MAPRTPTPAERPAPRRRGRPPGPTVDREQRRLELLAAAERAIRRIGADASMDAIATEAGITKPILYDHFGDKAGLASALADRVADDIRVRLGEVFRQDLDPRVLTFDGIMAFLAFIETEPALYNFLVQGLLPASGSTVPQRRLIARLGIQIAGTLRSHLEESGGNAVLAEPLSFAIIGSIVVAAEWWVGTRTIEATELAEILTSLVWDGVPGTRPAEAKNR